MELRARPAPPGAFPDLGIGGLSLRPHPEGPSGKDLRALPSDTRQNLGGGGILGLIVRTRAGGEQGGGQPSAEVMRSWRSRGAGRTAARATPP